MSEPAALDLAAIRALALAAIPGYPLDVDESTGAWEAWFSFHGDPYVVEEGRGQFGTVAQVATAPADYGRARAQFMGAADPVTVLAMCDELERCRAERDALQHSRDVLIRFAEVWLDGPGREEHGSMAWNFFNGVARPPALGEVTQ